LFFAECPFIQQRISDRRALRKDPSILILENEFVMGGLEKKLVDLASRIDRSHFRVVVCCLKKGGFFKADFTRLGTPFSVRSPSRWDA
jgi:hypothetical protein